MLSLLSPPLSINFGLTALVWDCAVPAMAREAMPKGSLVLNDRKKVDDSIVSVMVEMANAMLMRAALR